MKKILITDKLDGESNKALSYGLGMAKDLELFPKVIHVDRFADLDMYNHVFAGLNVEIQKDYYEKVTNANNERLARQIRSIDADFKELEFETLSGNPVEGILNYVKENKDIELIIMGKDSELLIDKILVGSVATNVINKVDRNVLLVNQAEYKKPRKILVPYAFSENCKKTLKAAIELSQKMGADIKLVNIIECHYDAVYASYVIQNNLNEAMNEMLQEARKSIEQKFMDLITTEKLPANISYDIILDKEGSVSESLHQYSMERSCDFIMISSHKRGLVMRTILGSVCENLVQKTSLPIMIMK